MSNNTLLKVCIAADDKSVVLPRGIVRQLLDMLDMPSDSLHEGHEEVIDYVRERIGDPERKAYIDYLQSFLHPDGDRNDDLNPDIHVEAMALCDGYGKMDEGEIRRKGLIWDWSHVRDSSVESLATCHAYIHGVLAFRG